MKSSNLALRLEDEEAQLEREAREAGEARHGGTDDKPAARRPRRSLESRSIVIEDQGFAPFRVR